MPHSVAPDVWDISPVRRLAITLLAVFVGEIVVMGLLALSGSTSFLLNAVFDGLFISFLVAPVLYWFLVRPLSERVWELSAVHGELERSQEAYRSLVDSTVDSIYLVDAEVRYRFVNRHYAARLGHPVAALLGRGYADFHAPDRSAEFVRVIEEVVRSRQPVSLEHRSLRDERWFLQTFTPVVDAAGVKAGVTVVSKDITELKRLERRLQERSTTDEMTGLLNRRGFKQLAAHRLKLAQREGVEATLVFADLDNLKTINDIHGHQAGDAAIRDAASVLAAAARGSDVVARIGGDEFVMLFTGPAAAAGAIVERIREALHRCGAGRAWSSPLSMSIGSATCPAGDACPVDELIARADAAMYEAKAQRRQAGAPAYAAI